MEKTRTYTTHPTAFIYQPVATPHQPRYAQQLPPGGSQGAVAGAGSIQRSALFHPQMGGCAARVAKLATPTNSEDFGLQQPMYCTPSARGGAKAALPQREAKSLPYSGEPAYLWGCLAGEPLVVIPVNVKYEQKISFFRQITPGGIC